MSDQTKKSDTVEQKAKTTELSEKDLEQTAGGAAQDVTVNKAKKADKAFQATDGYIRG